MATLTKVCNRETLLRALGRTPQQFVLAAPDAEAPREIDAPFNFLAAAEEFEAQLGDRAISDPEECIARARAFISLGAHAEERGTKIPLQKDFCQHMTSLYVLSRDGVGEFDETLADTYRHYEARLLAFPADNAGKTIWEAYRLNVAELIVEDEENGGRLNENGEGELSAAAAARALVAGYFSERPVNLLRRKAREIAVDEIQDKALRAKFDQVDLLVTCLQIEKNVTPLARRLANDSQRLARVLGNRVLLASAKAGRAHKVIRKLLARTQKTAQALDRIKSWELQP